MNKLTVEEYVEQLSGKRLEWRVAQSLGFEPELVDDKICIKSEGKPIHFEPMKNWWEGRALLESHKITVTKTKNTDVFKASGRGFEASGNNYFEAGLRCLYLILKSEQG